MAEQTLEQAWHDFCEDNGFGDMVAELQEHQGQEAIYIEMEWNEMVVVVLKAPIPLSNYKLALVSNIMPHPVKPEAIAYVGWAAAQDSGHAS